METKSISKIFNQTIFRVPDYQRGYSWTRQHLEQFWDDIVRLREDQDHYTGLLTVEAASDSQENNKWEDVKWIINSADYKPYYIVDGQQRLTTVIILLQAIIDKMKDSSKLNLQSKEQIKEQYICIKNNNLKAYLFGYEKDDPSYEFLKTEIFNEESSNSINTQHSLYTKNLSSSKTYFDARISQFDISQLENLFRKITLRLKFNIYEVDNDLDVFVMFETMNNRGKPLSKLEILKNRLIYLSTLLSNSEEQKTEIRNQINNSWRTIYEYLGKNPESVLDDDEFLKNHTFMCFGLMDDRSDKYADFLLEEHFTTANVYKKVITLKNLEKYALSIQSSIVKWFDIKFPENKLSDLDNEIRFWLSKIIRLKSSYFLPSIMGALLFQSNQNISYSTDQIIRLLQAMEKFAFLSFNLFQKNSNYKKNKFLDDAVKIYSGAKSLSDIILEIKEATEQQTNSIEAFRFHLERLYDNSKKPGYYGWNGLHYFLYEYELSLQGEEETKTTWENAKRTSSIEHVFPQNPSADWMGVFQFYDAHQSNIICNSLGNLLLISSRKNSSLSNKGFDYKKKHPDNSTSAGSNGYFNGTHSEINLMEYEQWTANEILVRGIKMLQFLESRWGVQVGGEDEMKKMLYLDFLDT